MTGYVPVNKNLTQEITVYDIPSTWSQLDMLNHLKAWGQVVAIKFKSQQKYVTVTVSIELNQEATRLWNDGAWTAPLGGLPVRWFPANWDLKQKKKNGNDSRQRLRESCFSKHCNFIPGKSCSLYSCTHWM
ncbi:uncharacterized protein OCT59_019768 [Rhizophagus irregularis]|uniref:uncharacterized protein n=1 Tax=Rhizophagus irregularis TaxID=588596 RepID=UPI003323E609|nr:hypothetical protein OCT59_019768 [Rhizophagus irregularis]